MRTVGTNPTLRTTAFVIAFIGLSVGVPFVYLPTSIHFDEAIFLVIAEHMADGRVLYQDVYDHKPPGIFILAYFVDQVVEAIGGPLSLLAYGAGGTEAATTVYVLRLLTAGVIGTTSLVLYVLGRQLTDRLVGMIAALVFLVMMYSPHFNGHHYLTEPFAILATVVAAWLLLRDRILADVIAGSVLAVGVLFNQTVFLFGLAYLLYHVGGLRDRRRRTWAYLRDTTHRMGLFGIGFGVPITLVLGYYATLGLLSEVLYFTIYIPLFEYAPPFDGWGRVLATASVLPVWLVGIWTIVVITRDWLLDADGHGSWGFVAIWAVIIAYPGATRFAASHQLTFAFAPLALLSGAGFVWLTTTTVGADIWHQFGRLRRRESQPSDPLGDGGRPSTHIVTFVIIGLTLSLVLAATVSGFYAGNVLATTSADQEEAAIAVDELVDGPTYTWPPQINMLYYLSEDIDPIPTYHMTVYSAAVSDRIIADLEAHGVQYLVVSIGHVEDGVIQADTSKWFGDEKRTIVEYLNGNFESIDETHGFVVFQRVDR